MILISAYMPLSALLAVVVGLLAQRPVCRVRGRIRTRYRLYRLTGWSRPTAYWQAITSHGRNDGTNLPR